MTDIYDEMYHLRNQRDAARRVIAKAEAEADWLRDLIAEHHTAISSGIPCEWANRRLWREAIGWEDPR